MAGYDRESSLKAFDITKASIKCLVVAGLAKVLQFFVQQLKVTDTQTPAQPPHFEIPVINLAGTAHELLVAEVRLTAKTFRLFQVVSHGVPKEVLDEMIGGVQRLNE